MSSASGGSQAAQPSPGTGAASSDPDASADPLIPLDYCDAPNQRFYAVSLFALQQSYKIFQFLESYIEASSSSSSSSTVLPSSRTTLLLKWAFYDILTLWFILPRLRIPRISFFQPRIRAIAVVALLLLNWLCVGDWRFTDTFGIFTFFLPTSWKDYFNFDLAILEHRIRLGSLINPASHILGSVTVHILPHSTAKLILQDTGSCYCISSPPENDDPNDPFPLFTQNRIATIPVLLNNTTPKYLQFSVQDFGQAFESRQTFNLTSKELHQIATHRTQRRRRGGLDYDSLDAELEEEEELDFAGSSGNTIGQRLIGYDGATDSDSARGTSVDSPTFPGSARENAFLRYIELEKTQAIWSFNVNRPGIVRIERIIDKSDSDVRIPAPHSETARILVLPCPSAKFHRQSEATQTRKERRTPAVTETSCQTDVDDEKSSRMLSVEVFGYPPLKLTYQRSLGRGARRESYTIDGIAPDGAVLNTHQHGSAASKDAKAARKPNGSVASTAQQIVLSHDVSLHGPLLQPQILTVPLNTSLSTPGLQQYRLEKIVDACGNNVDFTALRERYGTETGSDASKKGAKASALVSKSGASPQAVSNSVNAAANKDIMVYPRSQVSFVGCGTGSVGAATGRGSGGAAGQPVKLLKGGTANLQIQTGSIRNIGSQQPVNVVDDAPWSVRVQYEPEQEAIDEDAAKSGQVAKTGGWIREISLSGKQELLQVDGPGRYRILSIAGSHCGGEVYEPSECSVYTPAQPTVDVSLEPITDSCAGEVGLKAAFSLSGEPPYWVHYSVQHGSSRPIKKVKTIRLSREEIELRPEQTGDFTYSFISLDDANYNNIPIDRTVKQTVHPLAGVAFTNAGKGQKVYSCEGDQMQVPIELKGIAPWRVEYRIVGQRDVLHVDEINNTKHSLDVKIPPKIAKSGGQFTLSIERVVDGRGCGQPLAVDDLIVNVHRTQPTATLAVSKKVVVKESDIVHMPLRLTGEGPWTVHYRRNGEKPEKAIMRTNNGQITLNKPGRYQLVSVADAHCPGTVSDASKSFEIEWLSRPTVQFTAESGDLVKNGSLVRPPICEGFDDTAGLAFTGQAPYFVTFDLIEDGPDGHKKKTARDLQSIQKHAQFELSTTTPGHKVYDFTGISDSNYAQLSKAGLLAPGESRKSGRVRLEQDILARPTVTIAEAERKAVFCVRDSLDSGHQHAPTLKLTGAPPFRLDLEISPDGSQSSQRYTDIYIKSNTWKMHIPQHVFAESGPYTIQLRKIVDATGCERSVSHGAKGTFVRLEVADIASIAALQPQVDNCVGDSIDFVLQGSAPWTVQYDFEGKKQKVTSRDSRFSRIAEHPGKFKILSVAHHQDSCKSAITDISKTIHPLPRARVKSGNYYIENIREGDQAEITFEFEGTAPFTFTYTKSAPLPPGSKKGQAPTVLETHTITNVQTNKYSIYTQSEGTWNVVSVQDRYCAYPPLGIRTSRNLIQN